MTKIYPSLKRNVFYLFFTVFFITCLSAKNYSIKGVVIDSEGNKIAKTTVLLLGEDGTEVQRTETSKKRLGTGGGKFKFKKVLPGGYNLDVDAGELGKARLLVVITEDDISDIEIVLPKAKKKANLLTSMLIPKRVGVGVDLKGEIIRVPIWVSEKFVVEPTFMIWRVKNTDNYNTIQLIEYIRDIKFGLSLLRRFPQDELSFFAGVRIDAYHRLTIEDYRGSAYEDEELTKTQLTFGISPVLGAEYFFHKRFSLGSEIQVKFSSGNIYTDYLDHEESSNSIYTNTEMFFRFYLK